MTFEPSTAPTTAAGRSPSLSSKTEFALPSHGGGAWREEFERGDFPTVKAMAEAHGLDPSNVRHAFNLAFLSPRILEVIVAGWDMPPDLSVARLLRVQSLVWDEQEREFGFSG